MALGKRGMFFLIFFMYFLFWKNKQVPWLGRENEPKPEIYKYITDTGRVVDYSVKSLICFTCKNNKDSSDAWKEAHKVNCSINHQGKMKKDFVFFFKGFHYSKT